MAKFVGRKTELEDLAALSALHKANLCVVTGRRHIGKSRLLSEFAKNFEHVYIFSGLVPKEDLTAQEQRDEFVSQLTGMFELPGIKTEDWSYLFLHLAQRTKDEHALIILDEITWMGDKDPAFLPKLKNAWDLHFSHNDQLLLVINGSLSGWIDKNISCSTGFLGRIQLEMDLEELPLKNCVAFWDNASAGISPFEKLKMLAVTGGVPRYLESIESCQSAEDNIKRLCFTKNGVLLQEFKKAFSDLYKSPAYEKIVRCLADGIADQEIISKKTGIPLGGKLSAYLDDLTKSGFVSRDYTWWIQKGAYSKLSQYRLQDNYSRFYLKYIQPNLESIKQGNFQYTSMQELPGWHSMMGMQIENLILSNRHLIPRALNIYPGDIVCNNPFFQKKTSRQKGCQIDYMIQTKFNTLFICEIKFSKNEITTAVVDEMKEKINRLKLPKHFSYRCVLIHANRVNEQVEDSHFFTNIIDFRELIANVNN